MIGNNRYSNKPPPVKPRKVVYIDGAWDMFHVGHVEILKKARAQGDYLLVGVFNDSLVNQKRGLNYPVLNLYERVLSVLQCRYVWTTSLRRPHVVQTTATVLQRKH